MAGQSPSLGPPGGCGGAANRDRSRRPLDGRPPLDWSVPPGQPLSTRALGGLLRLAADPDRQWVGAIGDAGLPLGVDAPLPRCPAVFRPKRKWALAEWPDDPVTCWDNYASARQHEAEVRRQLREGISLGRVAGPRAKGSLASVLGCSPDDLVCGRFACLEEIAPCPERPNWGIPHHFRCECFRCKPPGPRTRPG